MANVNTPLTDQDILAEVLVQSNNATGSEFASDELQESRTNALKYYKGDNRGDELKGSSAVISMDLADTVDGLLTQLMPTFKSDELVQFEAVDEDDEEQARTESAFVNYVVMQQNNGYILFETLLKDTLLSKNCVAKVRVDVIEKVDKEKYEGLSEEELFVVLQPTAPNQEVDVTSFDEESGNASIKRITTKRKLCVEAVAPENFAVSSTLRDVDLANTDYCREKYWRSKSELIEEGFDATQVMLLPATSTDTKLDSVERNTVEDETNFFNTSPSMQMVEIEEHYIRIDKDGDGIAELHKVITAERQLLSDEEVDEIPYAAGVAWLMGHRHYGQSAYDKLKQVQDIKTHFLRMWSDNALVNNHNKTDVIEDQVEMEDFTSARPNAVRRVESLDSARDVIPHDIGQSCENALNYWDKVRTDRTGSVLALQANQVAMPSNVGDQGVNTLVANLEKVTAHISENFSQTLVESLYKLVHTFLRKNFPEQIQAQMAGQWNNTNPSEWREREQINVILPPTNSEKVLESVAIEKAIVMAQQDIQSGFGGVTTSPSNLYQMRVDLLRLSGIDRPEKYLMNPNSPESQQAMAETAQQGQQQQAIAEQERQEDRMFAKQLQIKQLEIAESEVNRNLRNDIEQLQFDITELEEKLKFDYTKLETDSAVKIVENDTKAELEEAKIVGGATESIELESLKHSHKMIEKADEEDREDLREDIASLEKIANG